MKLASLAVPVIGLARELTDLVFEEAFSIGVDDCCTRNAAALGRMLRDAGQAPAGAVSRRLERVVVADPDQSTRMLVGRVFRNAGYDVAFAVEADETLRLASDATVKIVVCAGAIAEAWLRGDPPWRGAGPTGASPAWIVCTPPKQLGQFLSRLTPEDETRVAIHDAFSAPANLLFVANELVHRPPQNARRSERALYGTAVYFRPAGRASDSEQVGYSYNISGNGLYVRSLAPPKRNEELWIELLAPRSDRRVHLEAKVVWARAFGPGQGATVPPGFGVELSGATATDLERYRHGYEAYLAERALRRSLSLRPG